MLSRPSIKPGSYTRSDWTPNSHREKSCNNLKHDLIYSNDILQGGYWFLETLANTMQIRHEFEVVVLETRNRYSWSNFNAYFWCSLVVCALKRHPRQTIQPNWIFCLRIKRSWSVQGTKVQLGLTNFVKVYQRLFEPCSQKPRSLRSFTFV